MTTPALGVFDPLNVTCPRCEQPPGERCATISDWCRKPHVVRVKLALVLAAHADAMLDQHFSLRSECGICGVVGLPQRHRVVDAIAGALDAGETEHEVMGDLGVSLDAVMTVTAWMAKWPGAWE